MAFDFQSLTERASFWETTSIWLAGAVAVGVIMESVVDFKILEWIAPNWLKRQPHRKEKIARLGLGVLIIALVFEVVTAIVSHEISAQIITGLDSEIMQTQERELALIKLTGDLGTAGHALEGKFVAQEGTLKDLLTRSADFERSARDLRERLNAGIARLKVDEIALTKAKSDAIESSGKAAYAAAIASKTATDMNLTLESEKAMAGAMRALVIPRVLSKEQSDSIVAAIKAFPGTPYDMYVTDDPDARSIMLQIGTLLSEAGWYWRPAFSKGAYMLLIPNRPLIGIVSLTGISIGFAEEARPKLEAPTVALSRELVISGITVNAGTMPEVDLPQGIDRGAIHIVVGKR